MLNNLCLVCYRSILTMTFMGTGVCCERCRKIRDNEIPCSYEMVWTDEVGDIPVCVVHGNNSRHPVEDGPNRPCITVDPWPDFVTIPPAETYEVRMED